ncbi:MAG: redoxin domain-containing protein, partial [Zavarzinella sp.]|nr:redoxin domain-containing protein [Zavarzinella sp.]
AQQKELVAEIRKAKGDERQKLIDRYLDLGNQLAPKFAKLADDNPKDPVATDAAFWIVQNMEADVGHGKAPARVLVLLAGMPQENLLRRMNQIRAVFRMVRTLDAGDIYEKANDKILALIANAPLEDLAKRLGPIRATDELQAAALKRAEADEKDSHAADLVAWAATNGAYLKGAKTAFDRLIEKYSDHKAMERVCRILGQRDDLPEAEVMLNTILKKTDQPAVQAAANFSLGELLAEKANDQGDNQAAADKIAAAAEKHFRKAIDLYGSDNADDRESAEKELDTLKTRRVGLPAPDIKGTDLDGKEFKLSDYRGKVVLLDFWGDW